MTKTDIRTTLLTLMDLVETENSANHSEVVESMIDAVMDGKLRLVYDTGKVYFHTTPKGDEMVEKMGT